jgi:repressor LexA
MLTRKQRDLLEFIHRRVQRDGVPPSFDEMKEALDLRSKSGIHRLITALEERGFIRRLAHRARAIEIVKMPEAMEKPGFSPRVIEGDRPCQIARQAERRDAGQRGLGHGRAGHGPDRGGHADRGDQRGRLHVAVPQQMLGAGRSHYALEVRGDSMIEAGINDGDVVVIEEGATADNGDIVVALVEARKRR